MQKSKLRQIYNLLLSISLVVAGICLMWACWQVYSTGGDHPYTARRVAQAFRPISIPVYIALALSLVSLLLPAEKIKAKPQKNVVLMLQKLHERNDLTQCGDQRLVQQIYREQKGRCRRKYITLALLAVGFVAVMVYSTGMSRIFSPEAHQSTQKIMTFALVMLGCFCVPFGYGIFTAYANQISLEHELALMKLVACPRQPVVAQPKVAAPWQKYLPYVGILAAIGLIIYGYLGDGHMGVLAKAIEICKECVGIG